MNLIRNLNRLLTFRRCFQTSVNTTQKLVLEPLMDREVIRLKGDEVVPFLQGLITNDIKHLYASSNRAIYAMFLNKAGRVMYDTILYSTSEPTEILMECDRNVANDIQRHLKLYRVRRKIDIDSLKQEIKVWQAFEPNTKPYNITDRMDKGAVCDILAATTDPRLGQLGARLLANTDKTFEELSELFKQQTINVCNENNFRLHRYSLGIAEGVSDLPPGKCFPLEVNCDILNGVSFHKGCYIGQELTARVHHTGVIRKRLMPVRLTNPLPSDDVAKVENEIGANCGTIYGSIANSALGLLRVEKVCKAKKLLINGKPCFTEIPQWWPQELQPNTFTKIPKDI